MELWLDSVNFSMIEHASALGILHGVTTNPSILAQSPYPPEDTIKQLLTVGEDLVVTWQVVADHSEEMVIQAERFASISDRIIVKVPVTQEGLKALHILRQQGIKTMATVVYEPRQALLASLVGSHYIAPYFSRINNAGGDALNAIITMLDIIENKSKLLIASLRTLEQVMACCSCHAPAITLKDNLFQELIHDQPLTLENMLSFAHQS